MNPLTARIRAHLLLHPTDPPATVVDAVAPELEGRARMTARQRASRIRQELTREAAQATPAPPADDARQERRAHEGACVLADLDAAGILRWQLARLAEGVREVKPGTVAHTRAVRAAGEVHAELMALMEGAGGGDELARLSPEEVVERLTMELRDWPDQYLELAVAELERRHQGRVRYLRVVEGERVVEGDRGAG